MQDYHQYPQQMSSNALHHPAGKSVLLLLHWSESFKGSTAWAPSPLEIFGPFTRTLPTHLTEGNMSLKHAGVAALVVRCGAAKVEGPRDVGGAAVILAP
jgi:hypothetical protein